MQIVLILHSNCTPNANCAQMQQTTGFRGVQFECTFLCYGCNWGHLQTPCTQTPCAQMQIVLKLRSNCTQMQQTTGFRGVQFECTFLRYGCKIWALLTNCIPEAEKVNFAAAPSNFFTVSSNVLIFMPCSSFSYGTFILMHN